MKRLPLILPFSDTERQPFQYRLELVRAAIRDDCGDAAFLVKVAPNGENGRLAIDYHGRGLTNGPDKTYKEYEIGSSTDFQGSKRNLRLEVFAGQVDDERLVEQAPLAMRQEWQRAKNAGFDDFHSAVKEFDLAEIVRAQSKERKPTYTETFTVISEERRNKYTFKLEVKIPPAPDAAK